MMKVSLVCFTRMGFETMKKIAGTGGAGGNEEKWDTSLWVAGRYALRLAKEDAGLPYQAIAEGGLSAWTGAEFQRSDALIFVGACGIAVRAIAPFVQDKFHDPAVLCVDEAGTFVIPLLSGHVGGANRLAEFVAGGIGAVPVVTTATDVERKFAVDVFAKDHGLVITDRVLAKRISADILAEEPVGVFSDFGFSGWKKIPEGLFRDRLCKRSRLAVQLFTGKGEKRDLQRICKIDDPLFLLFDIDTRDRKDTSEVDPVPPHSVLHRLSDLLRGSSPFASDPQCHTPRYEAQDTV